MKPNRMKFFFDVHMHAFNLSHAGLLAFINRFLINQQLSYNDLLERKWLKIVRVILSVFWKVLKELVKGAFIKKETKQGLRGIVNMLSIFESDLSRQFRYIELDYLSFCNNSGVKAVVNDQKNRIRVRKYGKRTGTVNYSEYNEDIRRAWGGDANNTFEIGHMEYNGIILTPLMMDFYYKGFDGLDSDKIHYWLPPRKPIGEQADDLFKGIHKYWENSPVRALKIFPFLAINPENYDPEYEAGKKSGKTMLELMDEYFFDFDIYKGDKRFKHLEGKSKRFLETESPEKKDRYYAGIKVYPPLGFDPWPEDEKRRKQVEAFYRYCIEKDIPITTHCSDGGFIAKEKSANEREVSPDRWEAVLKQKHFENLRLNFAHVGTRRESNVANDWSRKILKLVDRYDNVYFDISGNADSKAYYFRFFDFVRNEARRENLNLEKISDRMLFGTDFMMNLFHVTSYEAYVRFFSESDAFDHPFSKEKICSFNPYRFVFCGERNEHSGI